MIQTITEAIIFFSERAATGATVAPEPDRTQQVHLQTGGFATPDSSDEKSGVIPRVMANQSLFQAGNSLTTGSFFNYFVAGFHPSAFWLSVLMILPETMQALSVLLFRRYFESVGRKRIWFIGLVAGRSAAMLIPLAMLFPADRGQQLGPILFIAGCTAFWYLAQGIAFINYLSWISELAPRSRWGHLFSWRQIAGLVISVFVPVGTLMLRKQVLNHLPDDAERWSYAVIFTVGGMLAIASTFPLLRFPDKSLSLQNKKFPLAQSRWREIWKNQPFRMLLASRWTAAFFQGLTQSVLFKYAYDILKVPIETYMLLVSLMLVLQLPLSWVAGRLSDANRDRGGLFLGFLITSLAMPCWWAATAENWSWLIAAYACWGGFALVNVCGTSFCLKLSTPGANLRHLALYEQVSGLIAGLAGLTGGAILNYLLESLSASVPVAPESGFSFDRIAAFHSLILVSWIGRMIAPIWLLAIRSKAVNDV